jgi:glutamyl/glutaminyl-tRNA synthetase
VGTLPFWCEKKKKEKKKNFTKIELVKWFKVQSLSSNPSTAKKKKKRLMNQKQIIFNKM